VKYNIKNIVSCVSAALLVGLILLPSVLKLKHAILEHQTFVCKEKGKLHLHEVELDCDYHKFNLTHYYSHSQPDFNTITCIPKSKKIINFYNSLNEYEVLLFSRRGPPFLV